MQVEFSDVCAGCQKDGVPVSAVNMKPVRWRCTTCKIEWGMELEEEADDERADVYGSY